MSELVVGAAERGEVVRGGWSAFFPCGGVVEVAVRGWHAASGEDAGTVSCLHLTAL